MNRNKIMTSRAASGRRLSTVRGEYVELYGENFYRIANSHLMPEFFMSLTSSSDHWMFISSTGAMTAGRKNATHALFPYYSADKISDLRETIGPKSIFRIHRGNNEKVLWEPFSQRGFNQFRTSNNLYKNEFGNKLCLEEVNEDLGLVFRNSWTFGHDIGFVRKCELINIGDKVASLEVLDGLQNIMPYGVDENFQMRFSNLADAYKKCELLTDSGMGIYYLSSIPSDKAEPSEGLRATVAWQTGFESPKILLSSKQLDMFRMGRELDTETDLRAARGAYLLNQSIEIQVSESREWTIVAALDQDQTDVINLDHRIRTDKSLLEKVDDDVRVCQEQLLKILSDADARQVGANRLKTHRHQSNVLFNVMRGGLPSNGYQVQTNDFVQHVQTFNKAAFEKHQETLVALGDQIHVAALIEELEKIGDDDLMRIGLEYLPLIFSRRHGDPTRPWNMFSINLFNEDGSQNCDYQGNWRDIFQNWEALAVSYPLFARSMIFRFVNASTADGYNPYRVTKDGFEWESPDPDDPWANIGYWGDHQIIYLLKLLEWAQAFCPADTDRWLSRAVCTYANVPYRINNYEKILDNARDTVEFDRQLEREIEAKVEEVGSDGKLLRTSNGKLARVTLIEKLVVPALVKMTNFVPDGGIWLNTQRPEWNDANNALVGGGMSVVTVCYLRRYVEFLSNWLESSELQSVEMSTEVAGLLNQVTAFLIEGKSKLAGEYSEKLRREMVDGLSGMGSGYRTSLYESGLSGKQDNVSIAAVREFCDVCKSHLERTIKSNRRPDGLYHSYNLLSFEGDGIAIERLAKMLEGQVAAISSGIMTADECAKVLGALRSSELYREDQQSYMLYPDRQLKSFVEKNKIPSEAVIGSKLIQQLLKDAETSVVRQDAEGGCHFNGDFRNAADLSGALDSLSAHDDYRDLVATEREKLADIFEQVFDHKSFTGRSGTFFAYEGLGSIYWHMVSKLALAVTENFVSARVSDSNESVQSELAERFREIQNGIALLKTPRSFGAFPTDPYSHTPRHSGAQQPGMTGQVKEDILARFTELGVRVENGLIKIDPALFDPMELLKHEENLDYFDVDGVRRKLPIPSGSFAFTLCQVPFIFTAAEKTKLSVHATEGSVELRDSNALTQEETSALINRTGKISMIQFEFKFELPQGLL